MLGRIITFSLIAILSLAVIGTGYWGYQEHQDKNSILIKAESSYQRAFYNLNNNVSNLEDELGKSIAMNSRKLIAPCMANIWRLASEANSNVGQLPLMLMPFQETEKFLAKIADFTYEIGMRDIEQEPLSDKEWKQLKSLHGQAARIQGELRTLHSKINQNNIRWMDVELAVASENMEMAKYVFDGVKSIDKQVQGYIETDWGATDNQFGDSLSDKKRKIRGKEVSEAEVKKKVRKFLKVNKNIDIEINKDAESREYTAYHVRIQPPGRNDAITLDVSKKGGEIIWMIDSRDIEKTTMGLNEAQNKALSFLENRGITSMVPVESNQYDHVGVFDFVYQKDGVRVFTDLIRIKVALDNGDIIGYEALDYLVAHDKKKQVQKPKITLAQAKAKLNKNLKVHEDHLSMVELKGGDVKLCYEILGTIENETYRIFVNAMTGDEERIEKMKQAEIEL